MSFPLGENVLIDLFWQNWRLLKAQSLKSWKSKLCSFCERTAWWKSTHWLCLTNLVAFESSKALRAWKSKLCSQKRSMSRFPSSGKPTKWAKFAFSSFENFKAFKSPQFCQKRSMSTFSPSGKATKWAKFAFQVFKAIKPSKAPSFVKRGQWVRFHQAGSSQNEQSLVLMTKAAKNGRWVSYTFLQKLSSFKFYSILEEKCVVHINNGAIKCKTFVDKRCKKLSLGGVYFPTKAKFFQIYQHFIRKSCCRH